MIEQDRLPEQVFGRLPLAENPRTLEVRPSRNETIAVYNDVMGRLMTRREVELGRFQTGAFDGLRDIVIKNNKREPLTQAELQLMRDFGTLVHSEIARFSRANLNLASHIEDLEYWEAEGEGFSTDDVDVREAYQRGQFDAVVGTDHPVNQDILVARFVNPAGKDENFSIRNGLRVDGLIRLLDEEIATTRITGEDARVRVNNFRHQRDVLWTQSRAHLDDSPAIAENQLQLDAFLDDRNPMFHDNILRNWLNAENIATNGRILMIRREQRRYGWGCLPLLLPLPLIIPILTHINTSPCANTGGDLELGVFDIDPRGNYEDGANAQTMGYHLAKINQKEARSDTDPQMHAALAQVEIDHPGYLTEGQDVMHEDHVRAAARLVGHSVTTPFVSHEGFRSQLILPNCLSPEQVHEEVMRRLDRRNNPQWWHPIVDTANAVLKWLPKPSIFLR